MNKESVIQFQKLFTGLQRGYGILRADGTYQYVKGQPTTELYQQHLEGKISLGIVPITDKGNCKFAALDLDDHHKKPAGYKFNYKKLLEKIKFLKLPLTVFESKGGGAHCYLFLDQYYTADNVRHVLKKFEYALGYERGSVELFPKQNELKPSDNGNFINLPYKGGNSRVLIDAEGKELNISEAMHYAPDRVTNGDNLKKFKLIDHNNSTGRNDRTFAACSFIKKHNQYDWKEQLNKYNKIFNVPPLSDKELEDTVISSNEKNDYNNGTKESPPDATAWRMGTKASEIRETEYEDIPAVVEGLIFPGTTFITGKSKIGKSFKALQIANAVETGGTFLGRKCAKGSVLHYSLEDGKRRNKKRWKQMGINPTEAMYQFRDRKPKIPLLTMGLEDEIEDWIKNTPDAKLVIIDPYVKVKKTLGGHKLNSYENDNYNLQNIYTLANKYNIAIVFLHHTKKKSETDVFDEMNGSAGIQSNADSMIVLSSDRRIGKNIVLSCLPKDAEQQEFEISLNPKCMWEYVGKVGEAAKTELQKAILAAIKKLESKSKDGAKAEDIKNEVSAGDDAWSAEHVQTELTRLLNNNEIMKPKRGFYKNIPF